jgi:hypothetical protein
VTSVVLVRSVPILDDNFTYARGWEVQFRRLDPFNPNTMVFVHAICAPRVLP